MTQPASREPDERDALIDDLLARCLRAPQSEQSDVLRNAAAEHPEVAQDLRERFDILAGFGLSGVVSDDEPPDD